MIGRASAQRVSEKATAIKSVEKENGGKRTVFSAADDRSVRGGEYFGDYKMREKDGEVDEDEDEEGRRKQKGMMMYDEVPQCFICPLSKEMMRDPVVVESGETYDRVFIQARLNSGNLTCPNTQQILSRSVVVSNQLVRRMISDWCRDHGYQLPPLDDLEGVPVTHSERIQLKSVLKKMASPSISETKMAAKELRKLTKQMPSFRALLGEKPEAISQLVSLSSMDLHRHLDLQEDVVTTILNLSIHDNNKKIVGDDPYAISFLIDAVVTGTIVTRSNAAAALFTLSALDENRIKIGEMGGLHPLIELFEEDSPVAKKDAASAIFSLCKIHENKARAVEDGVVRVLLISIVEDMLFSESLAVLAMLSTNQHAIREICDNGGVSCMLRTIRESGCGRDKENAVVVLYAICMYDRRRLCEIRDENDNSRCIALLARNGTARGSRKAKGILDRLNKAILEMISGLLKKSLASKIELAKVDKKASLLAAVDYYVSMQSDIFISASPGNMHNAMVGHRTFENLKTIRPNMGLLGQLFLNKTMEWDEFQAAVQEGHANRQGEIRLRKPKQSIYTYPAPDCMCHQQEDGLISP